MLRSRTRMYQRGISQLLRTGACLFRITMQWIARLWINQSPSCWNHGQYITLQCNKQPECELPCHPVAATMGYIPIWNALFSQMLRSRTDIYQHGISQLLRSCPCLLWVLTVYSCESGVLILFFLIPSSFGVGVMLQGRKYPVHIHIPK
jgi:hypothetical protein